MSQVEAPNYLRKWEFGDSACYAELPKVADAVIEALVFMLCPTSTSFYWRYTPGKSAGERENHSKLKRNTHVFDYFIKTL